MEPPRRRRQRMIENSIVNVLPRFYFKDLFRKATLRAQASAAASGR